MAESLVSVEEFEARRVEPFTEEARKRADLLLTDASELVREAVPAADLTRANCPFTVRVLIMRLAGRAIDNPTGVASESVGDYSYRVARQYTNGLFLAPDEVTALEKAVGVSPLVMAPVGVGYDDEVFRRFSPIGTTNADGVTWIK
ncbi:hypothetical protein ABT160_23495 [Streptomyces sp. NPDC001941]|uniref:hypothetical protein n=1 Tax=Streptomyces sp. NPDC001941 TaxID=3154659 RepID=UPI00332EF4CB